jgi:hypothetical protein
LIKTKLPIDELFLATFLTLAQAASVQYSAEHCEIDSVGGACKKLFCVYYNDDTPLPPPPPFVGFIKQSMQLTVAAAAAAAAYTTAGAQLIPFFFLLLQFHFHSVFLHGLTDIR